MINIKFDFSIIENSLDIVDRVKNYTQSRNGRTPHNHINSIPIIMNYLGDDCKTYVEIGTYHGSSLITAMNFQKRCQFFGIDFFGAGNNSEFIINGKWVNNSNQSALDNLTFERVYANIFNANNNNHDFELIQGDSTSQTTIDNLKQKTSDGIDLLFIDGNHAFDFVIKDYNNYKDLINSGGFILFDDYGFLKDVQKAVDSIDFEKDGFEIFERIDLSSRNEYSNELIGDKKNATFIITKKK